MVFVCLSMAIGGGTGAYIFLRPYVKVVRSISGQPRLSVVRVISLVLLWLFPTAVFTVSRLYCAPFLDFVPSLVIANGLAVCVTYLWFRGCWLLDAHRIHSKLRQLLFLTVLGPGTVLVGAIGALWLLVVVLGLSFFNDKELAQFSVAIAAVGVPMWFFVRFGIRFVFARSLVMATIKMN